METTNDNRTNTRSNKTPIALDDTLQTAQQADKERKSNSNHIKRTTTRSKKKVSERFTPREKEVISLCCNGFSTKEIAERLDISVRTVDTHKINIFQKMEVNTTQKLVQFAIKHKMAIL